MRLHYLQHVPNEGLGSIAEWVNQRGGSISVTRLFANDPFPLAQDLDALVILGGPMNIYDEAHYPWLAREKAFIRGIIASGKPILALCLGSQLVADALGAIITRNADEEIGWFPITWREAALQRFPELPNLLTVFHWHEDTFSLPPDAILLASSEACLNQGYAVGNQIIALQFHPEVTATSLPEMMQGQTITPGHYVQSPDEILAQTEYFSTAQNFLFRLLNVHFGTE